MAKVPTNLQLSGSNSPTFIIKCGAILYVTQSVAVYDPAQAKTPDAAADIKSVGALFDTAKKDGRTREAVELPKQNNVASFQQSSSPD